MADELPTISEVNTAISDFRGLRQFRDHLDRLERILNAAAGAIQAKNQAEADHRSLQGQIDEARVELARLVASTAAARTEHEAALAGEEAELQARKAAVESALAGLAQVENDAKAATVTAEANHASALAQLNAAMADAAMQADREHQEQMAANQRELEMVSAQVEAQRKLLRDLREGVMQAAERFA